MTGARTWPGTWRHHHSVEEASTNEMAATTVKGNAESIVKR